MYVQFVPVLQFVLFALLMELIRLIYTTLLVCQIVQLGTGMTIMEEQDLMYVHYAMLHARHAQDSLLLAKVVMLVSISISMPVLLPAPQLILLLTPLVNAFCVICTVWISPFPSLFLTL